MIGCKLGIVVATFVCLIGGSTPVWGQGSGNGGVSVPSNSGGRREPPKPAATPKSAPAAGVVTFAEEKFRLDSVGLTMSVPEGATTQSTSIGGRATVQILPKETNWILNIQTPRTTNADASIAEATEKTIALLQGSVGVVDPDQKTVLNTEAKLLERNDNLKLDAGPCSRFYLSLPNTDKTRLVKGYTVFKPTAQQYVIFELITSEPEFAKVKAVYEAVLATASFADSEAIMAERGVFVKAGAAFFSGLSEADYVQAMHENKVWQRLYKPAATGAAMDAEEIGYRGVRFWRGKRGEVDPSKPIGSYSKLEQEEGYLCSVEGRRAVRGQWADTRQIYFMRSDRSAEAWSIVMVVRDSNGKQTAAASETGARDGSSLTIVTTEPGRPVETISPPVPDGYVSQFESFLLPRLLIRKKVQTTVGCYAWNTNKSVSFRKDEVSRESSGKNSLWTIKTVFRDQDAAQTYSYNDKGDLVRGEVDKVGVWEPMEPAQLFRLWEQKGLPTGKLATEK
jgi:hypothetical protein